MRRAKGYASEAIKASSGADADGQRGLRGDGNDLSGKVSVDDGERKSALKHGEGCWTA